MARSIDGIIRTLEMMKMNVELIWNENHPNLNPDLNEWIESSLNDLRHFRGEINEPELSKRYFIWKLFWLLIYFYFYRFNELTKKLNIVKLNEADVRNAIDYNQSELTQDVPMETSDSSLENSSPSPFASSADSPAHLQLDNEPWNLSQFSLKPSIFVNLPLS